MTDRRVGRRGGPWLLAGTKGAVRLLRSPSEIDRARWAGFVEQHPLGWAFHLPEMVDVYRRARNHEPVVVAAEREDGTLCGLLVAVIVQEWSGLVGRLSARSIVWGGPLVAESDGAEIARLLLREYRFQVRRKAVFTQVRGLWDQGALDGELRASGYGYKEHLSYVLDLTLGEVALFAGLNGKRRNEVRRASRDGVSVAPVETLAGLRDASSILEEVYKRARIPLADQSLFDAAFEVLRPRGLIQFFGAFWSGLMIGTLVVLSHKGLLFNWYAGARREHLGKHPNDLLPWEVAKWGIGQGMTSFDLGGAGQPGDEYGVRDFKKKFGGREVHFGRYETCHRPLMYHLGKAGYAAWRAIH